MAKKQSNTVRVRSQSTIKETKPMRHRRPVEWGHDDNGQQIVTRAAGRWARDLPAFRLRGLRDTIKDMNGVVRAFDASNGMPEAQRLLMLSMTASVARGLMLQAADDFRAVLALSPQLRAAIAREDQRFETKGGVA
jgi:hypothetical protein